MARIAVAMSGGVDSSVAAALLVGAGHEVVGFTLNLWPTWAAPSGEGRGCCGLGAVEDARSVARTLGIRHYVLNLREEFEREVIRDFAREYARGRTPNPCVACNRSIKFSLLLQRVRGLGMDLLATGHYARVARHPSGRVRLLRGADRHKDQSYVLACLTQEQLASVCFPVGAPRRREAGQPGDLLRPRRGVRGRGRAVRSRGPSARAHLRPGDGRAAGLPPGHRPLHGGPAEGARDPRAAAPVRGGR